MKVHRLAYDEQYTLKHCRTCPTCYQCPRISIPSCLLLPLSSVVVVVSADPVLSDRQTRLVNAADDGTLLPGSTA